MYIIFHHQTQAFCIELLNIWVLLQIFCEVSKQTAFYSLQYYNNGVFPIPKTFLVVLTEVTKLVTIVALSKGQCPISKYGLSSRELRNSAKYLLPSVFYGVNNNLYLLGLTMVAPPIFNILISVRTVITACVYKVCPLRSLKMTQLSSNVLFSQFILKRPITKQQMFGAFLIVISLAIAKAPTLLELLTSNEESRIEKAAMAAAAAAGSQTTNSSTGEALIPSEEESTVNALPFKAVVLGFTAACISGQPK